jgi:Fe-S cluster assembly protein SufD
VASLSERGADAQCVLGVSAGALAALIARMGEGSIPSAARYDALARFAELPARGPTRGRYWKHDLSKLDLSNVATLPPSEADANDLLAPSGPLAGNIAYTQIDDRWLCDARGGLVEPLATARARRSEAFERAFGSAVDTRDDKYASLALAFQNGGAFVAIPDGARIDEPIVIAYEAHHAALFPYTLVYVGAGASATIVERLRTNPSGATRREAGAPFVCGITEVVAGDRSDVTVVALQDADVSARIIMTRRAVLGVDARLAPCVADLGAELSLDRIRANQRGRGGSVSLTGVFFAGGDQHVDLETEIAHDVGDTRSDTIVKSAATGRGQGRYLGNIHIAANANGSDASLRDDALLLAKQAHIDSVPALEIASNDVKAFHGATIGSIDEDVLFYAESRGIARPDAERMIALGFFEPAIGRFPTEPLREHLRREVERKLT